MHDDMSVVKIFHTTLLLFKYNILVHGMCGSLVNGDGGVDNLCLFLKIIDILTFSTLLFFVLIPIICWPI